MKVRKCKTVISHYSSEVVNLDPKKFLGITRPYVGNSDIDFLNYIQTLVEDFYDDVLPQLDDGTAKEFKKLRSKPVHSNKNLPQVSDIVWFESGKTDSKNNFIPGHTTSNSNSNIY